MRKKLQNVCQYEDKKKQRIKCSILFFSLESCTGAILAMEVRGIVVKTYFSPFTSSISMFRKADNHWPKGKNQPIAAKLTEMDYLTSFHRENVQTHGESNAN